MADGKTPSELDQVDPYWYAYGPNGWAIETWRGAPCPENVQVIGYAVDYQSAAALVCELNWSAFATVVATGQNPPYRTEEK